MRPVQLALLVRVVCRRTPYLGATKDWPMELRSLLCLCPDRASRAFTILNQEIIMNHAPQFEVVDLGDAKVETRGPTGPIVEDNPTLPMRRI